MESSVTADSLARPLSNGIAHVNARQSRIHTISRSIADVDGSNRMIWNYIFDAVSFYLSSERRAACMRKKLKYEQSMAIGSPTETMVFDVLEF